MKKSSKIAVIGGTGKSGKYLVKELLRQGWNIKLLHRNPENLSPTLINNTQVEIIKGDARNYESIQALIEGTDAVISTLGQPAGEKSIFSDATQNVINAMNEVGMNRYILTTGLNVDTPSDNKNPNVKFATDWMKTNYPQTTADKQIEYELLTKSKLNWTLVRLPLIIQTDEESVINVNLNDCTGDKISSTSLAKFLIEQLNDATYYKAAPFISNSL